RRRGRAVAAPARLAARVVADAAAHQDIAGRQFQRKGRPSMTEIVIASAARTPVGSFNGAFASLPAHALGMVALKAAMQRAGVKPEEVDEVILGQILTAGAGQYPARQAAIAAGIPNERTAFGINQLCGSGLRAVALAA